MTRRGRGLTPDETELWRHVTRHDAPLRGRWRHPRKDEAAHPEPEPSPSEAPAAANRPSKGLPANKSPAALPPDFAIGAQRASLAKEPLPSSPPAQAAPGHVHRRARRGKVRVEGRLDLHGHTQESARAALGAYLVSASRRGLSCVLVITGRAPAPDAARWPDAPRGVIRLRLGEWLAAPDLAPLVSGWTQAHMRHGGAGAVYVFLRRR